MSVWRVASLAFVLVFMVVPSFAPVARTSAAGAGSPTPVYGGTLRVSLPVDAGTLDPRLSQDTSALAVDTLVFNGLDYITNSLQPVPDLAVSWKALNSKTWLFNLRQGVTFSDGHPFTSSDVVYTYKSILDPSFHAPFAQNYAPIARVVPLGKYQVQFDLKYPYAPLLSYLNIGIVPTTAAHDANFATNPVGTGPFVLKSWQRNTQIELVRNPRYFGPKPYLDGITFFPIPDNTAVVNGLKSHSLDLITSPLPPQDVVSLRSNPAFKVVEETGDGITYLNLNLRDPVLSDLHVRQALNLLVDRHAIADQFFRGVDSPAMTDLIPGTWAYDNSFTVASYDPARAVQILAADGWQKDASGILAKNGQELAVTLSSYNDPVRIEIITYLQNVFQQVGIKATIFQSDWPTFIGKVEAHNYSVALIGWLALVDPDTGMFEQFTSTGGLNWNGYANSTVDHLLLQARQASSTAVRKQLYVHAWNLLLQDVPWIVMTAQGWVVAMQTNVQNFQTNRTNSMRPLASVWLSH
jgi:peptide/nickel transport system substrate-binding protein